MEIPTIDHTDAYIAVCQKANLPINKLPKKGDKLELAYEMALQELNPALYQNLMSPNPDDLPADVAQRFKKGIMWVDDLKAYQDCGFTGTAQTIKDAMDVARDQMLQKQYEEMKGRNDARDEANRNKISGMRGMAPLPPEQVQNYRNQIGYTGLAEWQKG